MGKNVYANKMAISCKAGDGKIVAGFPSVCLSPPSPPAGPIPVPYPCSSFSRDLKKGSKGVKIGGKPVALYGQSFFKSSPLGNEACTKSFGMSVVTHQNTGKSYFQASSMDVKFEGKKVCRHLDLTTSNHASMPGEGPTTELEGMYVPVQQDAKVEGTHKCECCGGLAHSQAQADGEYMSEDQFYDTANNPGNAALLGRIRANPKCKHILPTEGKKPMGCNKYYATTKTETKRIARDWEDHNSARYRQFQGVPPGTTIAHRVPKAAGGCPAGQGNLAPTGEKCMKLETQLSDVQKRCADRFRP